MPGKDASALTMTCRPLVEDENDPDLLKSKGKSHRLNLFIHSFILLSSTLVCDLVASGSLRRVGEGIWDGRARLESLAAVHPTRASESFLSDLSRAES